jgi:hypothetical protein
MNYKEYFNSLAAHWPRLETRSKNTNHIEMFHMRDQWRRLTLTNIKHYAMKTYGGVEV